MLPQNNPDRIQIAFDDHRLVANAGLVLPATLARRLGLPELVHNHLDLGRAPGRANTGDEMITLVASALAGGDCIDDADMFAPAGPPAPWAEQFPQEFPRPDGFPRGEERAVCPQRAVDPGFRRRICALHSVPSDSGRHHSPRSGVAWSISHVSSPEDRYCNTAPAGLDRSRLRFAGKGLGKLDHTMVARFVAPHAFSAALRTFPWSSISMASS